VSEQEVWKWSAGEIVARVQARDVTVKEVTSAFIERAQKVNPIVNAIVTSTADLAIADAEAADHRLRQGYPSRPLEGVPFNVKDNIPVKGVRSTYASDVFKDLIPTEDAISVERFRDAGAILVGKSNTPEFADDPYCNTTNALFGQSRNPWDVNRTPGASSGGASAAIAAGISALAIGSDWGGSIRGPAAFCGLVGFRPSPGLIPVYPDDTRSGFLGDLGVEHGHAPMARTVPDVAIALQMLVGPDDRAPLSAPATNVDYAAAAKQPRQLRGRRIAFTTDYAGVAPVDPEIAASVRAAADVFRSLGCEVTEATPNFNSLGEIIPGSRALGIALRYFDYTQTKGKLSPRLRDQIEDSLKLDLATVGRAEHKRAELWHQVRHFMEHFDFLLSPTWGVCPFRIDVPFDSKIAGKEVPNYFDCILFTYSMSILGLPAISVPSGLSKEGLPMGVQIAGHRFADADVIEAATAYELARGPMPWPPSVFEQKVNPADPVFLNGPGVAQSWRLVSVE